MQSELKQTDPNNRISNIKSQFRILVNWTGVRKCRRASSAWLLTSGVGELRKWGRNKLKKIAFDFLRLEMKHAEDKPVLIGSRSQCSQRQVPPAPIVKPALKLMTHDSTEMNGCAWWKKFPSTETALPYARKDKKPQKNPSGIRSNQ